VDYSEMFDLVEAGDGHWVVNHAITGELAGSLLTTTQGIVLRDQDSHFIGSFPSVERALRTLYAVV